jgi:AAA ATPase domain
MVGTAGGDVLCPVVVGRDAELAALTDHLDAAVAGHGRLVLLVGEAGVGKSRLAREVAARAADRGLPVLSGRAVPGAALPFRPLSEALLARAGACRRARRSWRGSARTWPAWSRARPAQWRQPPPPTARRYSSARP